MKIRNKRGRRRNFSFAKSESSAERGIGVMRKILVTCECGQQMKTPRSSLGKMGTCLGCGRTMRITAGNTDPLPRSEKRDVPFGQASPGAPVSDRTDDARRHFGQAVDLYRTKRYAEALAVFDELAREYPGNPEIAHSREECIKAMRSTALLPAPGTRLLAQSDLDERTVRRIILDKLLNAPSDEIQLHAAELACKYLGYGAAAVQGVEERPAPEDPRTASKERKIRDFPKASPTRNGNGRDLSSGSRPPSRPDDSESTSTEEQDRSREM